MWKVDSLKSWLKVSRLWDTFYAYCHGGLAAARSSVRQIAIYYDRQKQKAGKPKLFRPQIETLEARYAPAIDWIGGVDTNWSTGGNWQGGVAPGSGADVTIGNYSVNVDASISIGKLTLSGGTLSGSNTLTLTSSGSNVAGTISSGTTLRVTGSLTISSNLTLGGVLDNEGSVTWSGGSISGSGGIDVNLGASLGISGSVTLNGATLNNYEALHFPRTS